MPAAAAVATTAAKKQAGNNGSICGVVYEKYDPDLQSKKMRTKRTAAATTKTTTTTKAKCNTMVKKSPLFAKPQRASAVKEESGCLSTVYT